MANATVPVDTDTMRYHAKRALNEVFDDAKDLDNLILAMRGHIQLMIPEVEAAARRFPEDDVPRYCALACTGEARRKLRMGDGQTITVRVSVAQKLARSVNALCDHFTNLGGAA